MSTALLKFLVWPLVAYLPTRALTVGLLATIMYLGVPPPGARKLKNMSFKDGVL